MAKKKKTKSSSLVPQERIEGKILLLRGKKVMLDRDLAELYGVETKAFNRSVKRNSNRFPEDFMFQLTKEEFENLRFHFGASSWGGRRYLPFAFTQEGVAMLSGVLHSDRAIEVNIQIMRAFVRLREVLAEHADLKKKIEEHDHQIQFIFKTLKQLLDPSEKPKKRIGF